MIETIARLRKIAERNEDQARATNLGRSAQAELMDMAVKWHWLAGEAAKLCNKSGEFDEGASRCARCSEKC